MAVSVPSTYDILDKYIDQGFAIVPIWGVREDGSCRCPNPDCPPKQHGKHPNQRLAPNGVKNASRDKALVHEWARRTPDGNWAARTGEPLTGGGFAVVLDIDPRNGGDVSLAHVQGTKGQLPETLTQDSGGGGQHYVFRSKEPAASGSLAPGIDLLGVGKYFMLEPSRHESGGGYSWQLGCDEIAEVPEWIVSGHKGSPRPIKVGDGSARDTVLGEAFAQAGMLGVPMHDGSIAVKCPWADMHSDMRGHGEDSSTVILPPAGGSHFGGFKCMHTSHCATRKWTDVLNALPVSAVEAAKIKFPLRPVAVVVQEADDAAKPEREKDPMQACKEKLSYKPVKNGYKLVNDIVNAITILSFDPRWTGVLRFDEFAQTLRFAKPPPWHPDDAPKVQTPVWTDTDVSRLDAWFRRYWSLDLKENAIIKAAYLVGQREQYNPLKDWLDALSWDGTARLDGWLAQYMGADDTPYTRFVGAKWMISAVARVLRPGCKADHLMVLEGAQGKGKSTALQILAGEDYFSDTPLEVGSKDSYVALRGKFIIELAELASTSKADADKVKAFFSSPNDSYRPPYGRELISVPRACVFAGTVNHSVYLRDETGNRRFWPIACGTIDLDGLKVDRDQLWAEAVSRYNSGEKWWPEFAERAMIEAAQSEREETDIWEEPILVWLNGTEARRLVEKQGFVTANQILSRALQMEANRCGRAEQMRIGAVMLRAQYERVRTGRDHGRVYGYRSIKPSM